MIILACVIHSLTWNQKSQLTHVSGAAAGDIEYKYDAMGRRVSKIVNSVTTNYLYDGLNLIAELDGDNNNAVIAWYVYAGLDTPMARIASDGSVLYYHQDILGSVITLTDASGNVVTRYNYSPFGQTEVIGTDVPQPFRFTGREYDYETGLYYYRARYYSPDMRRFISEDPMRFGAGDVNWYAYVDSVGEPFTPATNWYSYTGNNPLNYTDPLGLYDNAITISEPVFGTPSFLLEDLAYLGHEVEKIVDAVIGIFYDTGRVATPILLGAVTAEIGGVGAGLLMCTASDFTLAITLDEPGGQIPIRGTPLSIGPVVNPPDAHAPGLDKMSGGQVIR